MWLPIPVWLYFKITEVDLPHLLSILPVLMQKREKLYYDSAIQHSKYT